jgi:hypothetical protein
MVGTFRGSEPVEEHCNETIFGNASELPKKRRKTSQLAAIGMHSLTNTE